MKEYRYKTNEKLYNNGIDLIVHISFIKSESGKTMQPLQYHVQTPSGMMSTDYVFVFETTTLKDLLENAMVYYE